MMRVLPAALLALLGLLGAGAAFARHESDAAPPQEPAADEADADESGDDPDELRRELEAARREIALARERAELARIESAAEEWKAAQELEEARHDLGAFESHEQAARVAESELNLKTEQDGADDARDEMNQLAALYGEGDLADRTAEIVLRRAQRGLERAEESLRLARADHLQLTNSVLPREGGALRAAVRLGELELRRIEAQRRVSELEARNEIADLEGRIEDLEQDLKETEKAEEGDQEDR